MKFNKKSALFLKLLTVASVGNFMISEGNAGRFGTMGNSHGLNPHRAIANKTIKKPVSSKASSTARFGTPGNSHGLNPHRTAAKKPSVKNYDLEENQGANVAPAPVAQLMALEEDAQPGILRRIFNRFLTFLFG